MRRKQIERKLNTVFSQNIPDNFDSIVDKPVRPVDRELIELLENESVNNSKSIIRNRWVFSGVAVICVMLLAFIFSINLKPVRNDDSYILYMDVNPSIKMVFDSEDKLKEIQAINNDASTVTKNVTKNSKIEDCMTLVLKNLEDAGYYKQKDATVLFSFKNNCCNHSIEDEILQSVEKYEQESDKELVVLIQQFDSSNKTKKLSEKYHVSEGKIIFCNNISKNVPESGANLYKMNLSQLYKQVQKDNEKIPQKVKVIEGNVKDYIEKKTKSARNEESEAGDETKKHSDESISTEDEKGKNALTNAATNNHSHNETTYNSKTESIPEEKSSQASLETTSSPTTVNEDNSTDTQSTNVSELSTETTNIQTTITKETTATQSTKDTTKETASTVTEAVTTTQIPQETTQKETNVYKKEIKINSVLCNRQGKIQIKLNNSFALDNPFTICIYNANGILVNYSEFQTHTKEIELKLDMLESECDYFIQITGIKAQTDNCFSTLSAEFTSPKIKDKNE